MTLKAAGYATLEATDGKDALAKLEGEEISLIVCGLNMPDIDGIALIMQAKQLPICLFTPVIMLADHTQNARKTEGLAAGINVWLTTPFQPQQMLMAAIELTMP